MANDKEIKIQYTAEASEFINANKEIDAETKQLKKEFILQREQAKLVGDQYSENVAQLNYLSKAQELNEQKIKNTNEQLKVAVKLYGENSTEAQNLKGKLTDLEINQVKLEQQSKKANEELEKMNEIDFSKVKSGLTSVAGTLKDGVVAGAKIAYGAMKTVAVGAGVAVAGIAGVTKASSEMADELLTQSQITGYTTDELQQLAYTAEMVDVSVETMTGSQTKLTKAMDSARDGSKEQIDAFQKLGVEYKNADGTLRDSKDVWNDTIDALGQVTNESERDVLAMQLMGKSAKELNPLIKAGSGALKEFSDEAKKMGMVVSKENLEKLGALDDQFQKLTGVTKALKGNFGAVFAPLMTGVVEEATNVVGELSGIFADGFQMDDVDKINEVLSKTMDGVIQFIQTQLPQLLNVIIPVATQLIQSISNMLPTLIPILVNGVGQLLGGLVQVILTTLPTLLPALLDGITQLITSLLDYIKNNQEELANTVTVIVTNLVQFIADNLPLILEIGARITLILVQGILQALPEIVQSALTLVGNLISSAVSMLPDLLNLGVTLIENVLSGITSVFDSIYNAGANLVAGLWKGIQDNVGWLYDNTIGWAGNLIDGVLKKFGINSPSIVFRAIGDFIMQGMGIGLDDGKDGVLDTLSSIGDEVIDTAKIITPQFGDMGVSDKVLDNVIRLEDYRHPKEEYKATGTNGYVYNDYSQYHFEINDEAMADKVVRKIADIKKQNGGGKW